MRALLVCSGGGHLKQLQMLADRFVPRLEDVTWLTFDTALSRSLLAGQRAVLLPPGRPRDVRAARSILSLVAELHRRDRFDVAISTGALPAVSALPYLARRGVKTFYIESATRPTAPSLSGRIIHALRGTVMLSQYPSRSSGRWQYAGSIFDAFTRGPDRQSFAPRQTVVSVGTAEEYPYPRLLKKLIPLLSASTVLWQAGPADLRQVQIQGISRLPYDEMKQRVTDADLFIAHCGTGSALTAFEAGKRPLLVPRRASFGEHVDDHQVQLSRELRRRDLAVVREVTDVTADALIEAAAGSVISIDPPPFFLPGFASS